MKRKNDEEEDERVMIGRRLFSVDSKSFEFTVEGEEEITGVHYGKA